MNARSMSSKTESMAESKHLSSPAAAMFVKTNSNQALINDVVDNVTVDYLSIIVYSPPSQLSGKVFGRAYFLPNGAIRDRTSRPQMLWVGLSSSGTQAIKKPRTTSKDRK